MPNTHAARTPEANREASVKCRFRQRFRRKNGRSATEEEIEEFMKTYRQQRANREEFYRGK